MPSADSIEAIVLAAGLGTRMKSDVPKVLHSVCGSSMLAHLLEQLDRGMDPKSGSRFNVVVGHGREMVVEAVKRLQQTGRVKCPVVFTTQEKQLGTGHAVKMALANAGKPKTVGVFNGDLPLFTTEAFAALREAHSRAKSVATLASSVLPDAGAYGRVIRKGSVFQGVVERKDASVGQQKIREFNGGVYLFDRAFLEQAIKALGTRNASGEYYLPDVFAVARKKKRVILAHCFGDADLVAGANTMEELAEVERKMYLCTARRHMANGVRIFAPDLTFIGPEVLIGRGTTVGPLAMIHGETRIGERVAIGAQVELSNATIESGAKILVGSVVSNSSVGADASIGPMAHLRQNARVSAESRIGNFVEIKESKIGRHTNAAHLSYVGDADIGDHVNLGCGFITCNYDGVVRDGRRKHPTVIEDRVFVGSDSQVVAPIRIAKGTYIASGSTVTDSIEDEDSLVIARTRQVTKPGYAKKYRK